MAVRAIAKAVECFHRDKKRCPVFRSHGAITYDERIFSFKGLDKVSLWALPEGRVIVPLVYGEYQKRRFDRIKGQADLVYRQGKFYLYCTVDLPDAAPVEPTDFLGVDLGVANVATDSDGKRYSGSELKAVRFRHRRLRAKLQRIQTKAATRRLKKLAGKEQRFARHTNHVISKQIVAEAKRTGRGVAIEELTHIRDRVKARRPQRAVLHSWAFAQLRAFLTYKAALAAVLLVAVDPRNSSRECSICGHTEKANRQTQDRFHCRACGFTAHADTNAAANLRERGRAASKPAEGDTARLSELCESSHGLVKSRRI
jgi:IS605 OrfB family transposase